MLTLIALFVVLGCNSSEYIGMFIVCKQSQQHVALDFHAADPPRITTHPRGVKDAVPGKPVTFSIQATGTEPLNYQWECKIGGGSGEWQSCDVESFRGENSSTLTIPSVQKSNEGSYRCTVSNFAGRETSQCATLTVGKNHYEKAVQFICGSVNNSTYWMLIFIALSVVPGQL